MAANDDNEIASLRARLNELDVERGTLTERLERLQSLVGTGSLLNNPSASVTGKSRAAEEIALFRRLFAGRTDVFPLRWENRNTGKGGHVWLFFSQPIPARDARQLGAVLMTETLERRPELGFTSYDRLFPSQDTVPKGGFGNLIALPLQRRARDYGNSVFVDHNLHAYRDQWAFLASL
jgi:hypothetical protein